VRELRGQDEMCGRLVNPCKQGWRGLDWMGVGSWIMLLLVTQSDPPGSENCLRVLYEYRMGKLIEVRACTLYSGD
jgi:hypothetical protein